MKFPRLFLPSVVLSLVSVAAPAFAAGEKPIPVEVVTADGCVIALTTGRIPGASLDVLVETPDSLGQLIINEPRKITRAKYSPIPAVNRTKQDEAATLLAQNIAESLLKPENLNTEDGLIRVQDVLSTTLGKLPDGVLSQVEAILEADLISLRDPKKAPEYKAQTNNALAELTRVLTEYRKTGTPDVNTAANWLQKASKIPGLGFLDKTGAYMRERFQSVKQVIDKNDQVLQQSVAHMRMRHEQMKLARLELRILERYLEISHSVAQQVLAIIQEVVNSNPDFTNEQKAVLDKNVIKPLTMRTQMILREQAAVVTAFHQFRLLMDGNLDLIVVIGNIRETARLEATVFGAGKIIANEQRQTLEMANATLTSLDDLRKQTVEQIRQQGIQIREFPARLIQSTEDMAVAIDVLLTELEVAAQNVPIVINNLNESNARLKARLDEAAKRSGTIDLIKVSEEVNDSIGRRNARDVNQLPALPAPR